MGLLKWSNKQVKSGLSHVFLKVILISQFSMFSMAMVVAFIRGWCLHMNLENYCSFMLPKYKVNKHLEASKEYKFNKEVAQLIEFSIHFLLYF